MNSENSARPDLKVWRDNDAINRERNERREKPWVIYLDHKVYCRAKNSNEVRRISRDLMRRHPAAAISQRYEGARYSVDGEGNNTTL